MSTRSAIIAKLQDGKFHGIYCHSDGYISGVGEVLNSHYQDPLKIQELVELGDISSIGEVIGEKHDFDWMGKVWKAHGYNTDLNSYPESKMVKAYGRDREETGVDTRVCDSAQECADKIGHNGYVYVFDGGWTVNGKPLAQAIKDGENQEED